MSNSSLTSLVQPSAQAVRIARPIAFLCSLILLFLTSSCSINPATGGTNFVLMSESKEKEIGLEEHEKVLASMPLLEDEELLAYVREVGNKAAKVSHRPDLEYTFNIIDSPEINAFALPGGYVYVNRGLLAYLNSEAELAAVLSHEIGHITARHSVQQQARRGVSKTAATIGGFVTAVATGSNYVGSQISEVASIWAQAGLSGFSREHELEADSLAAEYLVKAGYDPAAMIDVITVLKNQEDFNKLVSNNSSGGYHGLFATHPRNDTRLQEAIAQVGDISGNEITETDDSVFRERLNGLIVGQNQRSRTTDARNRYYQELLGYTLIFPDGWKIVETTTTVTAEKEATGAIRIEAQRIQDNIEPRLFLRDKMGVTALQKSEKLEQYRLKGHTGVAVSPETGNLERVAAIYFGPRVFIFRTEIEVSSVVDDIDSDLLASIGSFRAIQHGEIAAATETRIRFVQATEFFDFTVLAQSSTISNYAEESLRLLNGYYPIGTPEAGEWVKIVE